MAPDFPVGPSEYEETASLVRELDALKRYGSNLLVVGTEEQLGRPGSCRHFLGDSKTTPRRRMFVFTDADGAVWDRVNDPPSNVSGDRLQVIRYRATDRSAAAASAAGAGAAGPGTVVESTEVDGSLSRLGVAISAGIDRFVRSAPDELDPAEFRLCFDSLVPLLAEFGREPVFRFVHLLTHRVRSVRGMAHFHLPVQRDDPTVTVFEPLFDATVELSVQNGSAKQRWSFRDGALQTGWLEL